MVLSNAERQAAWRARREQRLRDLTEQASLRNDASEIERLKAAYEAERDAKEQAQIAAAHLNDQLQKLKKAASKPAKLEGDPSLQRQLKAARTRVKNLVVELTRARRHALGFDKVLSKTERRALLAALHPDNATSETDRKRREETFKIVNKLPTYDVRKTRTR